MKATASSFGEVLHLLRYGGRDYEELATFDLKKALGSASSPTHYLAIPPSLLPVLWNFSPSRNA
jgi:hypothetical protein